MLIEIPDEIVKRITKAANWQFGKDTPENQIMAVLEGWCDDIEQQREKEEKDLNERIAATKRIIAASKKYYPPLKPMYEGKCKVFLTNGTDRIVYGLTVVPGEGYLGYLDADHKKITTITSKEMHTTVAMER